MPRARGLQLSTVPFSMVFMLWPLVATLLACTLLGAATYLLVHLRSHPEPLPTVVHSMTLGDVRALLLEEQRSREAEIAILRVAVSEGIAGYNRHEKRVQKTVSSARRLVREAGLEHAGIEAEHAELQQGDDETVEPLPAMPEEVAGGRTVRVAGGHLQIG